MDILATASLQHFVFGPYDVQVMVPDPALVRAQWEQGQMPGNAFPYWSKLWPSATALCTYLAAQPALFRGKHVVELGAGLGLPSLLCAQEAASVLCTDWSPDAVRFSDASAKRSGLGTMRCAELDWMIAPQLPPCDLLLLSDLNYDPAAGYALKTLIDQYRQRNTTIILSTPQRPAGRAFAADILPWVDEYVDMDIPDQAGSVAVTLFRIGSGNRDGLFTRT